MQKRTMPEIHPETLATLRERGKGWAAYQNVDLSSRDIGQVQFIQFGEGCTFAEPPARCPDSHLGFGWRYSLIGTVNLTTGLIEEKESRNGQE